MKKFIFLFFIFFISREGFSFNMSPDGFEKRIDGNGNFQEYTFKNNTGKTIRYRIKVHPGKNGKSMHKWIEYQPKFMTIKNGESKNLKLFIKSPKGTPIGDYHFYLGIENIIVPSILKDQNSGIGISTTVGLSISIEMLGWVGDLPAKLKLENYKFYKKNNQVYIKGRIKNLTKDRFVKFSMDITNDLNITESIPFGVILEKETKDFNILLPSFKKINNIWKIQLKEKSSNIIIKSYLM